VLSVIPADSEDRAIDIANDSAFGLSGGVFTPDSDKAYRVARRMRTGRWVRTARTASFFSMAFGGFRQSGIGREGVSKACFRSLKQSRSSSTPAPSHLSKAVKPDSRTKEQSEPCDER